MGSFNGFENDKEDSAYNHRNSDIVFLGLQRNRDPLTGEKVQVAFCGKKMRELQAFLNDFVKKFPKRPLNVTVTPYDGVVVTASPEDIKTFATYLEQDTRFEIPNHNISKQIAAKIQENAAVAHR